MALSSGLVLDVSIAGYDTAELSCRNARIEMTIGFFSYLFLSVA
jgi:hypothetical protein